MDVAYTYDVVFGNVTAPPTTVYASYRDTAYYYNGTAYNPLQPGPPCSVDANLFFPDSVSFGAAIRPEGNNAYRGPNPDVTSLSLQDPQPGKGPYKDSRQGGNKASFGLDRAKTEAEAIFGNPQKPTPETPTLPPLRIPPAPPLGPPPPPTLPIVGRRK